jgi:membrane protein DedA with SNARE-associated domain
VTQLVSIYGVWLVAAFIALESVGVPLPAEATLMAAGFLAARKHGLDISSLLLMGILAAIFGEVVGFWIGRTFGFRLLSRYGAHVGLTETRLRIGQRLFVRYGGRFVFVARFLPILRNVAATLAGTSSMSPRHFYLVSGAAAIAWITCYGLGAYSFGEEFTNLASPAAIILGLTSLLIVLAVPALVMRYEISLLAKTEHALPSPPLCPPA